MNPSSTLKTIMFWLFIIMLAVLLWIRLWLNERAVFDKMVAERKEAKHLLRDSFARWPNCFESSTANGCSLSRDASSSMASSVGFSMSSQKGWPASMSSAISDAEGSQTTSPALSIQLRTGRRLRDPASRDGGI